MTAPLADRIRPQKIDEVIGQKHILGEGKILRKILASGFVPNLIFYGPSGVGKTTVANIISGISGKRFFKLNATNCSVSDVKDIVKQTESVAAESGVLLYLDEIQNFNKKQQQSLLEVVENGSITLIASTTENPYFYVYGALLSRCSVFEFKPLAEDDIEEVLFRGADKLGDEFGKKVELEDAAASHIAAMANGDVRKSLNSLELAFLSRCDGDEVIITLDDAVQATQKSGVKYDRDGDNHYDILSAFQKSIRGSDADAAVHYLARLVASGDLISICRRLMVIASEDIGLAYPMAASIVNSCCDSAMRLGFPEARIPLAEAVILLATAPKSNSAICAIDDALSDIESGNIGEVPSHLRDSHYGGAGKLGHGQGYIYPHGYPDNYVPQQYLPDKLKNKQYYKPGGNKTEQAAADYWKKVRGK